MKTRIDIKECSGIKLKKQVTFKRIRCKFDTKVKCQLMKLKKKIDAIK